jgi:DNA-binding NtrC family response regulator
MKTSALEDSRVSSPTRWILVVDDEPVIQQMVHATLDRPGWTVRTVGSAQQALDLVKVTATPPSLLICDVIMPRIDGTELTRRLLGTFPELKVIIISGHLSDASWWPEDLRDHPFLAKPFPLKDLISAVENSLPEFSPTE